MEVDQGFRLNFGKSSDVIIFGVFLTTYNIEQHCLGQGT